MLQKLLLLCTIVSQQILSWKVDERCLRRRQLDQDEKDEELWLDTSKEIKAGENRLHDDMEIRLLTERELQSTSYRFNFRLHWEEGDCWQEEWIERFWCAQCEGPSCNDGDILEIQTCKRHLKSQHFTWIPTKGGGRLKHAYKSLCLEKISTNDFELRPCSTSVLQILVGFDPNKPFEMYPFSNVGTKCLTQEHHPKPYEVLYTTSCDTARKTDTNLWRAYWSNGTYDSTIWSTTKPLTNRKLPCIPSNPCSECMGNCTKDTDCMATLQCTRTTLKPVVPVPGCSGTASTGWGYCFKSSPTAAPTTVNGGTIAKNKTLTFPIGRCTIESPCEECHGDCRYDLDCKGDLVCFQKDGDVQIPGCIGKDASRTDWCINPKYL